VGGGVLVDRPALAGQDAETGPVAERVVLPGETLWGIAGEVAPGVDRRETVAQIMELNDLASAEVRAGQRLAVPAPPR
jgi:LysM repeat protein